MSATTIVEFGAGVDDAARKLGIKYETLFVKVAVDLFADIVRRTPVDTGRARVNWQMTEGSPGTGSIGEFSKDHVQKSRTKDSKATLYGYPVTPPSGAFSGTRDIYIVNNLPYIGALEEGHSQQAPFGMVELAIENQKAQLESAVDKTL